MKKTIIFLAFIGLCFSAICQVPGAFNYQAVVRNSSGEIISGQMVSFRISILTGSQDGSPVFSEIHHVNTNDFGLANLKIGMGENKSGTFSPGGWGNGAHFIKVEIDINGGAAFTHIGTTQLLSVPYAFHSQTVAEDNVDDADADPENELQELQLSGTILSLSKSDVSVTLPSTGGGDNWGTDVVISDATLEGDGNTNAPLRIAGQDAEEGNVLKWNGSSWVPTEEDNPDNDPENELQEISLAGKILTLNKAGGSVDLSSLGGGSLSLPYSGSASSSGTLFELTNDGSGNGLSVNSTSGTGDIYTILGKSASTSGTGVRGEATSTSGFSAGVEGTARSDVGNGVIGRAWSSSGGGTGVYGESRGPYGVGIFGSSTSTTGTTMGIRGSVESASGYSGYFDGGKFYVQGNAGFGTESPTAQLEVAGQVKITGGSPGAGKVLTSDGVGLATWETPSGGGGLTLPFNGSGSSSQPLLSLTQSGSGAGVYVFNPNISGEIYCFTGWTNSTAGIGVHGHADSDNGSSIGVSGSSKSTGGIGVRGTGQATTGVNIGVLGITSSSTGYSGYFDGGNFYVSGNAGIGWENPTAKLDVNGQVKIRGGDPGAGKVLTSDGVGLASWQEPSEGGLTLPYSGTVATSSNAFSITNTSSGAGIYSNMTIADGFCLAVYGKINSISGTGVLGWSDSSTGNAAGVRGHTNSPQGFSGLFDGGKFSVDGQVGIKTTSPSADLDVNGLIKIRGGSPGPGKVLTSDGVGLASWQAPSGGSSLWTASASNIYFNTGNVGIGTSSPSAKIEVVSGEGPWIIINDANSGSGRPGIQFKNNSSHFISGDDGSDEHFGIYSVWSSTRSYDAKLCIYGQTSGSWGTYIGLTHNGVNGIIDTDKGNIGLMPGDGRVGVGTLTPSQALTVIGDAYKTLGGTTWATSSDVRLKTITGNYSKGLNEIIALRPVRFIYKKDNPRKLDSSIEQVGFVAQEVQEIFPDAVNEGEDGYLDFSMHEINVALVNAVKELKAENNSLKDQNKEILKRLDKLENIILSSQPPSGN